MSPHRPVVVRPAARHDILDAALWYDSRAAGLGARFLAVADATLKQIAAGPEHFRVVYRGARRAILADFPYAVYFVEKGETIHVFACIHGRRHPRIRQRRIRDR